MFDTAYYLHYVLDTENDSHYTEDLMRLSPASYLWHMLKERHSFSRVVFVNLVNNQLMLETFDNASYQLLQPVKKGLFGKIKEQPMDPGISHKTFYPAEIKQEDSTLLSFLLECQQNYKKERSALVFTAESLEVLCDRSDRDGRSRLTSFVENHALSAIAVVRLGMSTSALRKAFLGTHCFLAELDRNIREVLRSHAQQPLLDMLVQQLGGQLTDLSREPQDMHNLLMYDALESNNRQDGPGEIRDQAEYLRLCLDANVDLASDFHTLSRHEPIKRDAIYGKLSDPEFRSRLRANAARLRYRDPEGSMEDLFRREFRSIGNSIGSRGLCCEDELYRKVCTVELPGTYLKENPSQGRISEALRKSLGTLWNKPRNPKVCDMVRTASDAALEAIIQRDWSTLTDAMTLLSLCSRQICANPALNDNLDIIFASGQELLYASADLHRRDQSFHEMYPDDDAHVLHMNETELAAFLTSKTTMETDVMRQSMLRTSLYDAIICFNEYPLSNEVEQKLQLSMRRWKEKLDQSQATADLYKNFLEQKVAEEWSP